MPISKDLKERWIARLESPEAKWAGKKLLDEETGGMCCLGHLAFIQGHLDATGEFCPPCDDESAEFDEEYCILISRHESLFGEIESEDLCFYGLDRETQEELAKANDELRKFPLDLIRALPVADDEGAN